MTPVTLPVPSPSSPSLRSAAAGFLGLPLLALLAACGAGAPAAVPEADPGSEASAGRQAVKVRTAAAEAEDVEDTAVLPAELLPWRRAVIAAEVPGTVEAVSFETGDRVRAGQVLARIDTRALEQAVAEAEALARQAEDQHQRAAALFEKRSITRQQLVDATAGREVAAARLASARLQLAKSRIAAPWSGRIAARRVEVGDYVVPGQPVAELLDATRLKVRAPASTRDAPHLAVGAPVEVRVDALPGEALPGEVARLGAEVDRASRTLTVEAEIANPGEELKPGMLARLEIPRQSLPAAVLVPLEALVDLGGSDVLYVVEAERARRREVRLGPVVGARVVVLEGLAAGERVIVEGARQVADGQWVAEQGAAEEG